MLNYFVYPHVEVGGVPYQGSVEKRFRYRDVEADDGSRATNEAPDPAND